MKIRDGFVSNSSTSSFVCILSKKDHEKALAKLSKEHAKIIKKHVCLKGKIAGIELVGYGHICSNGGNYIHTGIDTYDYDPKDPTWDDDNGDRGEYAATEAYETLIEKADKFEVRQDC